jgi:hypothetical protein
MNRQRKKLNLDTQSPDITDLITPIDRKEGHESLRSERNGYFCTFGSEHVWRVLG